MVIPCDLRHSELPACCACWFKQFDGHSTASAGCFFATLPKLYRRPLQIEFNLKVLIKLTKSKALELSQIIKNHQYGRIDMNNSP
jgi:hypothetical protein